MKLPYLPFCVVVGTLLFVSPALAQEGGRLPIVARGDLKQEIKSTPILERPNRPLHFYGNAVRRQHNRGATQQVIVPPAKPGQ